jgi:hypothetical protein
MIINYHLRPWGGSGGEAASLSFLESEAITEDRDWGKTAHSVRENGRMYNS